MLSRISIINVIRTTNPTGKPKQYTPANNKYNRTTEKKLDDLLYDTKFIIEEVARLRDTSIKINNLMLDSKISAEQSKVWIAAVSTSIIISLAINVGYAIYTLPPL